MSAAATDDTGAADEAGQTAAGGEARPEGGETPRAGGGTGGTAGKARPFAAFELRLHGPRGRRHLAPARAAQLAAMLRHAALGAAQRTGQDAGWIEQWVAGHGTDPRARSERLSYLVLPSPSTAAPEAGAEPGNAAAVAAPAELERVLIAEPVGGNGEAADWAQTALRGAPLRAEGEREPWAELVPAQLGDPAWRTALGPAQEWVSATPLLLPGHDDHDPDKAAELLRRALAQAGWQAAGPELLAWQTEPLWPGALPAAAYTVPQHLRARARLHVRVRFRRALAGPLAAGAGRHAGLGILAATSLFAAVAAE